MPKLCKVQTSKPWLFVDLAVRVSCSLIRLSGESLVLSNNIEWPWKNRKPIMAEHGKINLNNFNFDLQSDIAQRIHRI